MRLGTATTAGALTALVFWTWDGVTLTKLSFAGVSDAAAQARVVGVATPTIALLEVRLAIAHMVLGALLGLLAGAAIGAGDRRRAALAGATATALVHLLAVAGTMASYPQLYVEGWWARGGARALLQHAVTNAGPHVFDAVLATLLLVMTLRAVWNARGLLTRWRGTAASLTAVLVAAAWIGARPAAVQPAHAGRPNVLIVAADSLRTDRLVASVMPFTASLVPKGILYRQAFTPIARTFPSWVSTLTGTEPRRHHVRTMFPRASERTATGATLFHALRDEGWRTFVVSDFAGDVFRRFDAGFDEADTPTLTVDELARGTVLPHHGWSLPLLRLAVGRALLPEWRNLAHLSDPDWLVTRALKSVDRDPARPFAGLVFFGTSHFPYPSPWPYYRRGSDGYRGRYLYDAPPLQGEDPDAADIAQIRARYDGAIAAVDGGVARLMGELEHRGLLANTIVVITGDHGEALFDEAGAYGHGDQLLEEAQRVPVLILGPGVAARPISDEQVRLYDLPATLLELAGVGDGQFGDGSTLLRPGTRPVCVETGIWFQAGAPAHLRGSRLDYPSISELLEMDPTTREIVLRDDARRMVEAAKDRGIVLGHRLWHERPTPAGVMREERVLHGLDGGGGNGVDLARLFAERCVAGDPELASLFGTIVYEPHDTNAENAKEDDACASCGLGR